MIILRDEFINECHRLEEIIKEYKNPKEEYERLKKEVVREELCSGGAVMHRGYYCPSLIQDIVVGNVKRGKILKRPTVRSRPTFRYRFNSSNQLIVIDTIDDVGGDNEIIIYSKEKETGILFNDRFGISLISECVYKDNKLDSYTIGSYASYKKQVQEIEKEIYAYSSDGLTCADWYDYFCFNKSIIIRHNQYCFQHDDEGCLSTYTSTEYDEFGNVKPSDYWKGHIFEVDIKRKV